MTDVTMRSLLDVHRTELNERDAEISRLTDTLENVRTVADWDRTDLRRKLDTAESRAKGAEEWATKLRADVEASLERVKKLQEANASLNALLTSERSAFSSYRDTHPKAAGETK